ncbi:MAG: type IX secretion system anionic LPS delivery protein PorZ [Flavobacteriales bacterium]
MRFQSIKKVCNFPAIAWCCVLQVLFGLDVLGQHVMSDTLQENRPVGTWSDFLPYGRTAEVIYCGKTAQAVGTDGMWAVRAENSLFLVHQEDNSMQQISRVQGMSGSDPTAIAWDYEGRMLVVGYATGSLDFFSELGEWIYTLNDIRDSNLIGDKSVLQLVLDLNGDQDRIYAACAFGVVVINPRELDIRDTWYIQGQQNLRRCHGLAMQNDRFVVWTDAGIFEAPMDHPFLSAPAAWTRWSDVPLETGDYRQVLFHPDGFELLLLHLDNNADELWQNAGGLWNPLPNWNGNSIMALAAGTIDDSAEGWYLAVADFHSIQIYDTSFDPIQLDYSAAEVPLRARGMVFHHQWIETPNGPVLSFQDLFIANHEGGLLQLDLSGGEADDQWEPSGPPVALVRAIDVWNDRVWIASGGVDETWTPMYLKYGLYGMNGSTWTHIYPVEGENDILGINDVMCVSIDPLDPTHVFFGTWEEGLLEVKANELIEIYNDANSTLELGDFGGSPRIGIGGVDFDALGNLWLTNAHAPHPLQVRLANGAFHTMDVGTAMGASGWMGDVLAARNGYIWCIMPRNQGLLVYDTNKTPEILSDDDWRILTTSPEDGGLPSDDIYCLEEDLDGEIWIGTAAGPCVIYLPSLVFESGNSNPVASQILIQQDGNYQLLLETEVIPSICIDGGNRKWIGTQNSGVYLLSADGVTQEAHFTESNSPLLSNQIFDIAINHRNGEVLIGTAKGLMGWRSDATNFVTEIDELRIYPNPVRGDFEGWITVDGLAYKSTVHVTTASGRLIATLTSEGGRAIWDGKDLSGTDVPYGVYLVFATDADGKSSGTTKIAVIR